ncbi:GNAT family N-acetyltransferase [Streptomyces sp. NPDC059524]|uniref:GNAT family N-acetyltransferase n=1 Tax=Streptomyces sp. NPDC059524 TaxID=3346856 RepID=UPI00368330C9
MSDWIIEAGSVLDADVDDVMREYFAEMGQRVMGRSVTSVELDTVLAHDPHDDLGPPSGAFLVARSNEGEFLGCAGVQMLNGTETAELKRMYVRPAGRGTGLGKGLLRAVEETAVKLGATRIVCETNTQLIEARTLYARHGYQETAPYEGHGRADHWFVKKLTAE